MRSTLVCVIFALTLATFVRAADKPTTSIDGTWKWSYKTKEGKDVEAAVKLKRGEGDKLTGAYVSREGVETPIDNGTIKGDELSFDVTRDIGGNKMLFKYTGKLAGDTITGKILFGKDKPTPHDWEATRGK